MTEKLWSRRFFGFRHSAFFRHSSFEFRHSVVYAVRKKRLQLSFRVVYQIWNEARFDAAGGACCASL